MRTLSLATLAALGLFAAGPVFAQTAVPASPSTAAPKAGSAGTTSGAGETTAPASTPHAALIDINSASKEELDALPGIGAARAEAILKGRPYKSKDELSRKKIIPENVYNGIKDKIVARQKS